MFFARKDQWIVMLIQSLKTVKLMVRDLSTAEIRGGGQNAMARGVSPPELYPF